MLDMKKHWAPLMDADGTGGTGGDAGADGSEDNGSEGTEGADKGAEGQDDPRKIPKYTEDDMDKIVKGKVAKLAEAKQKELDEATKLATMNATEKAEYEKRQIQEELDKYKRKEAINNMISEARTMLKNKGLTVPDNIIATLVAEDAETTKSAVEAFAELFNQTVDEALKSKMKGNPPKTGAPGGSLTREEIMAIPDGDKRRQAIQDNISLFENK